MITTLLDFPQGKVRKADLYDALLPSVLACDVEPVTTVRALATVSRAPLAMTAYRRLGNEFAYAPGMHLLGHILERMPKTYADVFCRLRMDENGLAIPLGHEHLALFVMLLVSPSNPFSPSTADVRSYMAAGATVSWTKPTTSNTLPYRFTSITLVGCGGTGGGGGLSTTAGNQAAGGGGGGGGGLITRTVYLSTLSTGNVVLGNAGAAGTGSGTTDVAGGNGANGGTATFAGLTAGGGSLGTGGGAGAGAQTGAGGAGGTGDVAGSSGGTGRSGATVGDSSSAPTSYAGSGGGGGGGATAETAQANGGAGGNGFSSGAGGGAAGTAGGGTGGNPTRDGGAGGGGGGSDASATAGGASRHPPPSPSGTCSSGRGRGSR